MTTTETITRYMLEWAIGSYSGHGDWLDSRHDLEAWVINGTRKYGGDTHWIASTTTASTDHTPRKVAEVLSAIDGSCGLA